MNEHALSDRLACVGAYVPDQARLADIGSDHAYLPVALMLQNKISYAVAGEVVEGPYRSASKQVQKNRLGDSITVRLANGLAAILPEDQIDTVVIAGMGGPLIRTILEEGQAKQQLTNVKRLILQPNVGEWPLRVWLQDNGYQIIEETILSENDKQYEIIVAEPGQRNYSKQELFFGPRLIQEKNAVFQKKWHYELQQKYRVIDSLQKANKPQVEKITALKEQIRWIEEVLA